MQYEASIYDYFILIPIVLLLIGIGFFAWGVKEKDKGIWWMWWVGLGFIIGSSIIVLLLPVIKGYWCVNRHDMMEHIGLTMDMSLLNFSKNNSYPIVHIIPAGLAWLGIGFNLAVGLMPMVMYLFYLGFVFMLGRGIFGKTETTTLLLICASLLLLPISGLYDSSTVFIIIVIGILAFCLFFTQYWQREFFFIAIPILIVFIGSFVWLIATRSQLVNIGSGTALVIPAIDTQVNSFFEKAKMYVEMAGLNWFDIMWLILKMYGGEIVFGILAVISLIFLKGHGWRYTVVGIAFMATNLGFWLYFFGWIPEQWAVPHGYTDILIRFIPCFSIILAAPLLLRLLRWKHNSYIVLGLLLCIAGVISIFKTYPSPFIYQPNPMVSQLEVEGAKWLIEYKEDGIPIAHLGTHIRRYGVALYGVDWWRANSKSIVGRKDPYPDKSIKVPNHLGYNSSLSTIGDVFNEPTYLIITGYDKKLYTEVWKPPIPTRWTGEDFMKLRKDPNAVLQYWTSDFEVWLIKPRNVK